MRFLIMIFSFIMVLAGCGNDPYVHLSNERERSADMIIGQVARQLKREKGLCPCGSGGQTSRGVKMLALCFNYYKEIGIEEGRELLIDALNCFVTSVNEDERIRPYLVDYPFQSKNIEIMIVLKNSNGSKVMPGKLCVISTREGFMEYDIRNPEDMRLKTILRETYDEAVKKVAEKTSDQNVVEKMAS